MSYTIPNEGDAGNSAQAAPDKVDFDAIASGSAMTGVVSGCAVTAQGTPDMTVAVASGTVAVLGTTASVTSGNVTITAAHATLPRFDLVVSNSSGTKSAVAGTASSNPVFPAIPASSVLLAAVYVAAAVTTITSGTITDKRVTVPGLATTAAAVGTSAGGSATTLSKSDHVHATGAGTPSTQAFGDAAATGSGPAAAMTDHKHAWPALGTTAAAVGTSAGGSATTPSKSDHVHATGAGTPSTQAFGDAAATGSGPAAAMTDHKHAMPANPTTGLVQDIIFVIDGGGATITTGVKGDLRVDFACTIVAATLLADQSGSIVVNVWKDTLANYPPVVGDKITASAPPTITTATNSTDTTLTGWTTSITAGDTLRFNVDSVTTIQRVALVLKVTRT